MNLIAALLMTALQAQGQPKADHPIHEEYEVLRTKAGHTLPKMMLDLDATLTWITFDDINNSGVDLNFTTFQVEGAFGITDWLTAELEIPFVSVDLSPGPSESGLGDIAIDGKVSVMKGSSPLGFVEGIPLAFGTRISLPTGDDMDGTGEKNATLRPYAAVSYEATPEIEIHGEISLEWQSEAKPIHRFNAAADFHPWSPELSLLAALNFSANEFSDDVEVLFIPGVEYRIENIWLGAGIPLGITSDAPDFGIVLNFQIRLGPLGQ